MIQILIVLISLFSCNTQAQVDYRVRYGVTDRYSKITDNKGLGDERLYGTRNARMVFANVLRGGANNVYLRNNPRANSNPLPMVGLQNLCKEGFDQAIYLYSTNYESSPKSVDCIDDQGRANSLTYHNLLLRNPLDEIKILKIIRDKLKDGNGGLYLHCWNGWHASGYFSAISLIQYCGISAIDAVEYWNKNTDGVNQGEAYDKIRTRIINFKPYPELNIDQSLKSKVCI